MIVYRKGISIRVLLRISGSVMPRAAVNALLSAALTYLISCVIPPEVLLQLFNHPYPFQPMAHVVAFALVFRTNVAYNRYWESCTEVCLMSAKWGDTFAEALSFDDVFADERMLLALKKSAVRNAVGEEAVSFLVELMVIVICFVHNFYFYTN